MSVAGVMNKRVLAYVTFGVIQSVALQELPGSCKVLIEFNYRLKPQVFTRRLICLQCPRLCRVAKFSSLFSFEEIHGPLLSGYNPESGECVRPEWSWY